MKNEIVLYQAGELTEKMEIKLDRENETFWLSLNQLASLFDRDKSVIYRHIRNIFNNKELDKNSVVAFFATTANDGKTYQVEHYNLDITLSVGYRVNSIRGTQFRIWANRVLKEYLMKGFAINKRVDKLENRIDEIGQLIDSISLQLKTHELPTQGIFFDGQVFEAYAFTSALIKKAKKEVILIDNYINENTLTHLAKKAKNVQARLFTGKISKTLALDIQKANEQYGNFEVHELSNSHDRFLIIDRSELYHLGASLKDLGKKWFAFSKLEGMTEVILGKLKVES